MSEKEMLSLALEMGFADAAAVDTKEIEFVPAFRPLCAENLCGKYGANYCCPPDCGTVEEMKARVLRWPRAILLQTLWDIDDPLDNAQTKPAKGKHNKLTREWIERTGMPGLMIGASGCNLCNPCAITEGAPCRFPEKSFSCMSAYCIFVRELTEKCGMDYDCGPGVQPFFSLFCYEG